MRIFVVSLSLALMVTTPALAWHDAGHRATASIAFDAMTDEQRRFIAASLHAHPRFGEDFEALMPTDIANGAVADQDRWMLEQAATWPDLIQALGDEVRQEYNRSRWHYINLVIYLTDDDKDALDGRLTHNMSTEFSPPMRQNLNSIQALRGNLQIWHDADATDGDKAVALCWILHLAGDMHQPLHNVALFSRAFFPEGDRGGNSIDVAWGEETRNLHAVWDGLPTDMEDLIPTARTLKTIESETVDDQSIDEWLRHHGRLAEMFVYPDDVRAQLTSRLEGQQSPQVTLSHEYLVRARSVVRRQVNLAGHRIAILLTEKKSY